MARSAFATACCFVFLLAMSGTALAEQHCGGIVITDVTEGASGELTPTGERCYERGPGVPFYYDAPGKGPSMEIEAPRSMDSPSSITTFDSGVIQALGAQPIEDLANPFPTGRGEADSRPE